MKKIIYLLLVVNIVFLGCKKSDRDNDTSTNSSEDFAMSTGLVLDIFKIIHQASSTSTGIISSTSLDTNSVFGCDTIIYDGTSSPKTLRVVFDENCTSSNISRNGTLYATYNGFYDTPGTKTSIGIYDYKYNDYYFISGTLSYQLTDTTNQIYSYSISISDAKILNNYNQKIFYNASYQLKINNGSITPVFNDDNYSIKGLMTGRAFKGNAFSAQILDSLVTDGSCNWISSGNATVIPESKNPRTLNFGVACDNAITVSVYELNYELNLP